MNPFIPVRFRVVTPKSFPALAQLEERDPTKVDVASSTLAGGSSFIRAGLAQLAEHLICNQGVASSKLATGTIFLCALPIKKPLACPNKKSAAEYKQSYVELIYSSAARFQMHCGSGHSFTAIIGGVML